MLIQILDVLKKVDNLKYPHMGKVVDNVDPKKLGRVKCTIAGMFESIDSAGIAISNDKLPWVFPLNPTGTGGGLTHSSFAVPEIGSELVIEFPFEDVYHGFYIGYWQSSTTHQTDFDIAYPNTYGWRDSVGNILKVEKTSGDVKFTHKSGTFIKILNDGSVEVDSSSVNKNVSTKVGSATYVVVGKETVSETLDVEKVTQLNKSAGTTFEVVTKDSICAFTGLKHPQGCGGCKVAGTQA